VVVDALVVVVDLGGHAVVVALLAVRPLDQACLDRTVVLVVLLEFSVVVEQVGETLAVQLGLCPNQTLTVDFVTHLDIVPFEQAFFVDVDVHVLLLALLVCNHFVEFALRQVLPASLYEVGHVVVGLPNLVEVDFVDADADRVEVAQQFRKVLLKFEKVHLDVAGELSLEFVDLGEVEELFVLRFEMRDRLHERVLKFGLEDVFDMVDDHLLDDVD